jgi:hypothetical protein
MLKKFAAVGAVADRAGAGAGVSGFAGDGAKAGS